MPDDESYSEIRRDEDFLEACFEPFRIRVAEEIESARPSISLVCRLVGFVILPVCKLGFLDLEYGFGSKLGCSSFFSFSSF